MRIVFLVVFLCYSALVISQSNNLFSNAKPIDEYRYEGVRASPYQFDTWVPATIYTSQGDPIQVDELNINGYSKELEIRRGDKFIELDQSAYSRIEISLRDETQHVLVRNFANNFRTRFIELVHDGAKIKCVRQFLVPMIDFEIQNVGKTEKIKRFNPKFTYTFIREGILEEVKLKEKTLITYLGNKKEMSKVLDKSKFKSDQLQHLKEILAHYESL